MVEEAQEVFRKELFMKKLLISVCLLFLGFSLCGCEKVGYKEGTYSGSALDNYNNEENTATAEVVINNEGKIESVYIDTTYQGSTKKTLGYDYNMQKYYPSAQGEWFEQVERLEKAIVENQGTEFLKLNANGKTDAVSGCTIEISAMVKAVDEALSKAK